MPPPLPVLNNSISAKLFSGVTKTKAFTHYDFIFFFLEKVNWFEERIVIPGWRGLGVGRSRDNIRGLHGSYKI